MESDTTLESRCSQEEVRRLSPYTYDLTAEAQISTELIESSKVVNPIVTTEGNTTFVIKRTIETEK